MPAEPRPAARTVLERLALHTPELRAWTLYDWANSVFMTTVLQVFQVYFPSVAAADMPKAKATERFAIATSVAVTLVALIAPVLGALADHTGIKKKLLGGFMLIGSVSTAALFLVRRGDWELGVALFVLGNVGATGSIVFYESLLPHVAKRAEMDRACTTGFALGYLGGGLLLAVNLLWIQWPEAFGMRDAATAMRISFLSAGAWWMLFSIPILTRVAEPPSDGGVLGLAALRASFGRLRRTLHQLRSHRDAWLMLCAFLVYNDGINTIIRMAVTYGGEVGIARGHLIAAILMVQFVGIPFSLLFGTLAGRIGPRNAIHLSLVVYGLIAVVGYRMTTAAHFYLLAFLVGTVQGGSQALSRSLYASMIPPGKSAELFGFFGVFEKFGGVVGPAVFATAVAATGSSRPAILSLVAFFVLGGLILSRVDVARGRAAALRTSPPRRFDAARQAAEGPMLRLSKVKRRGPIHRTGRGIAAAILALGLAGCSIKKMAVNSLGNALAEGGSSYASDEDTELVRGAVPFGLKTVESLLEEAPRHKGLLFAAASGFTQYAFAYVQQDADFVEAQDLSRASALRTRARKLYLRARNYGLRGLDVDLPGFRDRLSQSREEVLARASRKHVPLLYWTGLSWFGAISLAKNDSELSADQGLAESLMKRALELDEGFGRGTIHDFYIAWEGRGESVGGSFQRAREHLDRALVLAKGHRASPFVTYAESVSVSRQDRREFEELLRQALAIDPDAETPLRLSNLVYQQRARWLLGRTDDLFVE